MLNDLFKVIRLAEHTYSTKLFEIIRNDATPEEIRAYIDRALATIQSSDVSSKAIQETATKLKGIRRMINLQGPSPSFRRNHTGKLWTLGAVAVQWHHGIRKYTDLNRGQEPDGTISEYESKIGRYPKVDWYPNLHLVSRGSSDLNSSSIFNCVFDVSLRVECIATC
jgi:hypothetical protein